MLITWYCSSTRTLASAIWIEFIKQWVFSTGCSAIDISGSILYKWDLMEVLLFCIGKVLQMLFNVISNFEPCICAVNIPVREFQMAGLLWRVKSVLCIAGTAVSEHKLCTQRTEHLFLGTYCRRMSEAWVQSVIICMLCLLFIQPASDSAISVDRQVVRDLMESAYRLVHCLSPEFVRTFNWQSFVAGLESRDLTVKWSVHICGCSLLIWLFAVHLLDSGFLAVFIPITHFVKWYFSCFILKCCNRTSLLVYAYIVQ